MIELLVLFLGGLLAGALGGMLGIGGGIVLMPLLRFVVGLSPAHAAGTCILAVFFTTLGGSYRHCRLGRVRLRPLLPVIISGAMATVVFSMVFLRLAERERWLDLGLGLVFSVVSMRMIAEWFPGFAPGDRDLPNDDWAEGSLAKKSAIGIVAGILPGLLGIGTGAILVPAFTFILKMPIKIAMASSLTCFCTNAFVSSAFKLQQGFVDIDVAVPVCVGTFLGANLGAVLNRRFPSSILKLLFGLLFSYVSLKFILLFFGVKS